MEEEQVDDRMQRMYISERKATVECGGEEGNEVEGKADRMHFSP